MSILISKIIGIIMMIFSIYIIYIGRNDNNISMTWFGIIFAIVGLIIFIIRDRDTK